jgi:hypothetical protein
MPLPSGFARDGGKADRSVRAASQETCRGASPITRAGRAEERSVSVYGLSSGALDNEQTAAATTKRVWGIVVAGSGGFRPGHRICVTA